MPGARSLEMPAWECHQLLREHSVGRVCVVTAGHPVAFPISYCVAGEAGSTTPSLLMRTRPDGLIAQALGPASLEIDHIDAVQGTAWSVIVRGTLVPIHDRAGLPVPQPWLRDDRHAWLAIEPQVVSGRRFVAIGDDDTFAVDWEAVSGGG